MANDAYMFQYLQEKIDKGFPAPRISRSDTDREYDRRTILVASILEDEHCPDLPQDT
jgi:hypothetical protein